MFTIHDHVNMTVYCLPLAAVIITAKHKITNTMVVVGGLRNDMLPVFSSSWIIGDILMDGTPQAKYWGPGLWSPLGLTPMIIALCVI